MSKERPDYLSYLLRVWRANGSEEGQRGGARPAWRASLESPHTRRRRSFGSLDEMVEYLRRETEIADGETSESPERHSAK